MKASPLSSIFRPLEYQLNSQGAVIEFRGNVHFISTLIRYILFLLVGCNHMPLPELTYSAYTLKFYSLFIIGLSESEATCRQSRLLRCDFTIAATFLYVLFCRKGKTKNEKLMSYLDYQILILTPVLLSNLIEKNGLQSVFKNSSALVRRNLTLKIQDLMISFSSHFIRVKSATLVRS